MAKSSTRLVLICGLPASGKSTLACSTSPLPKVDLVELVSPASGSSVTEVLQDDGQPVRGSIVSGRCLW